MHTRANS
jgi:hypothetical protein